MTTHAGNSLDPTDRARIMTSLDRMVKNGRVTDLEAAGLRAATELDDFGSIVRSIRLRHAEAKLNAAVEDGRITHEEADANLERLQNGEDPGLVRALHRGRAPGEVNSLSVMAATLFAEGHGPGRNPWWVNVILGLVIIGSIAYWRVRAVRKRRSTHVNGIDRAGRQ